MLHKKDPAMGSFLWKRYRSAESGVLQNVVFLESGLHLLPERRIGQVKAQLLHEAQAFFPGQRGAVVPDGELQACGTISGQDKAVVQKDKGDGQGCIAFLKPAKEDQNQLAVIAAVLIEELELYEPPGRIGAACAPRRTG